MDLSRSSSTYLLVLVLPLAAVAFHTGAPESVCDTMTPGHPFTPQTGKSPFRVIMQKTDVAAGESVDILLTAPSTGPPFKGFLIEVHPRNGDTAVGQFKQNVDEQAQPLKCGGNLDSAMTHKDLSLKTQIKLQWTPPGDGQYIPVVTWVQQLDTFWVKEMADKTIMVVGGSDKGPSQSGGEATAEGGAPPATNSNNNSIPTPKLEENHAVSSLNNVPAWTTALLLTASFFLHRLL